MFASRFCRGMVVLALLVLMIAPTAAASMDILNTGVDTLASAPPEHAGLLDTFLGLLSAIWDGDELGPEIDPAGQTEPLPSSGDHDSSLAPAAVQLQTQGG